jgi:phosphoribosyl-ATP pyrophosphohydrolase/phosphoribosyl-AMP cyclohydrolase
MNINFAKEASGLIPAVIQDQHTDKVLMLGFMNKEAYEKTVESGQVTFYSRTRKRLWTKGEESGNFLNVVSITTDCDQDSLLIRAIPAGPVCHTGADTCWEETNPTDDFYFLKTLQDFIAKRKSEMPMGSYTTSLFESGTAKISQKVGEEAVETIIEAMANNDERLIYEASDLIYHLMVLLSHKGLSISDLATELKKRHK